MTNSVPVVTILKRPTPPARQPPAPAPVSRIVRILMNPKRHASGAKAASSAPKTLFRPERMVRLPKVIVHPPVWGDKPAKVDHPGSSCGVMLEAPVLNCRMRMDLEDLLRFYPDEWAVEHNERVQRARDRRARHAAARRQASRGNSTTPSRSGSVATPTSPPLPFYGKCRVRMLPLAIIYASSDFIPFST